MLENKISVELKYDSSNSGNDILVSNNKINSITINQSINSHHFFEIRLRADVVDDRGNELFQKSRDSIGKKIKIHLYESLFIGVATDITISKIDGDAGDIIISGFSPTFFINDNANTQSFSNKTLAEVIRGAKKPYADNDINFKNENINPQLSSKFGYLTQYGESCFDFINRLALNYGEWFFYDGQQTYFGLPNNDTSGHIPLYYGSDLVSFDVSMKVDHVDFKNIYYNYEKNEVTSKTQNDTQPPTMDNLSKFALDVSKKFAGSSSEMLSAATVSSNQEIDQHLKLEMASNTGQFVFLDGVSTNSKLKIGSLIEVKRSSGKDIKEENYGNYRITHLTHTCSGNGNYQNKFKAVPEALKYAPGINRNLKPKAPSQVAIVKKNNDPSGLGRVQVQFLWQENDEITPWLRTVNVHAGSGRGFHFVPEVGDEVLVCFYDNNPDTPYVTGSMYHGNAKPGGRGITTAGGNSIIFSDEKNKEQITISNKKNKITVSCEADGKIVLYSDGDIYLKANKDIKFVAKERFQVVANEILMATQASVNLDHPTNDWETKLGMISKHIGLGAKEQMILKSDTDIKLEAPEIDGESQQINLKAQQKLNIESELEASLKAGVKLDIDGGAAASLKGVIVKIN